MRYPKEAIEGLLKYDYGSVWLKKVCQYAAWAHEQLRRRKMDDEQPQDGTQILAIVDGQWQQRYFSKGGPTHMECDYWLPMPPLPEPEDMFEGVWRAWTWGMESPCSKEDAKRFYDLGVKAGKEGK